MFRTFTRRVAAALAAPAPSVCQRGFSEATTIHSYIGRQPVMIPDGVDLSVRPGGRLGSQLVVGGPRGELALDLPPYLTYEHDREARLVKLGLPEAEGSVKRHKQMYGTTRALLHNAVAGVSEGWMVVVRLQGIGYRAALEERDGKQVLNLKLGFSHPVYVPTRSNVKVSLASPTSIVLEGEDKQQVMLYAAAIRRYRKPEPYKGKGIYVGDETIKLKERKKAR